MESQSITSKLKFVAQVVEKFVEDNLIEKEQRDENLRKLALAFETFVKDNPLKNAHAARAAEAKAATYTEAKMATQPAATASVTKQSIQVKKWPHFKGDLPKYQSEGASGFDIRAQISEPMTLSPGQRTLVPTGLSFALPPGYELQARPRSGWAIRDGITLLNTPGTIDADYRGEVKIILANLGEAPVVIQDQDRVAQLVLAPVVQAEFEVLESLDETGRGAGGFGSTGKS
jgi:dUTP pyrophosphatase